MDIANPEHRWVPRLMPAGGFGGAPLWIFEEVSSTNAWLLERGESCAHGETARALRQSAGRGRHGRSWVTSPGAGLAFSVVLRPSHCPIPPACQGAVAALALAICFEAYGLTPRLKWPNDVLLAGRKLAGILGESSSDAPDVIVVGVGCNLNEQAEDFSAAGLAETAISLALAAGRSYDPDAVFNDILRTWRTVVERVAREGTVRLAREWQRRDALAGRQLTVDLGGQTLSGLALGVDADLGLRLRDDAGVERSLRSGEVLKIGNPGQNSAVS